ncbi:unnamed protein product, partial [Didymodactylos carnosus]
CINHASVLYCGTTNTNLLRLNSLQYGASLAVSGAMRGSLHEKVCTELGWVPLFIKQENEDVFPAIPIKYDFFAIHRLCL